MRRPVNSSQGVLYGYQCVHVGHRGPVTGNLECVLCRVSLALSDDLTCCGACPGLVVPAPPWALLTATGEPVFELGRAA